LRQFGFRIPPGAARDSPDSPDEATAHEDAIGALATPLTVTSACRFAPESTDDSPLTAECAGCGMSADAGEPGAAAAREVAASAAWPAWDVAW
jgi:hypothetical protein